MMPSLLFLLLLHTPDFRNCYIIDWYMLVRLCDVLKNALPDSIDITVIRHWKNCTVLVKWTLEEREADGVHGTS